MKFTDKYMDLVKESTDAPDIYHEMMGYFLISCAVNRGIYMNIGTYTTYPNLWIILFGGTTQFRKSSSIDFPLKIFSEINPDMKLPSMFSLEGLADYMAKQPQGYIHYDEFAQLMKSFKRDYLTTLQTWLTQMFGCPDREVFKRRPKRTKTGTLVDNNTEINNVFINIVAATTIDWFSKSVTESDFYGGFLPRFIMVPAIAGKDFKAMPRAVDPGERYQITRDLEEMSKLKGEMILAGKAYDEYVSAATEIHDEIIKRKENPAFARIESYLARFTMLENVNRGEGCKITPAAVRGARGLLLSVIKWTELVTRATVTGFDHGKLNSVLRAIPIAGTITVRELLQRTNILKRNLEPILETLTERGDIEVSTKKTPGPGRPSTIVKRRV